MGKEELWKDFNYLLYIPYTFSFRLTEPSYGPAVGEEIRVLPGVKEVLMESELMTMLDSVKRWTQRAGLIVFVIPVSYTHLGCWHGGPDPDGDGQVLSAGFNRPDRWQDLSGCGIAYHAL